MRYINDKGNKCGWNRDEESKRIEKLAKNMYKELINKIDEIKEFGTYRIKVNCGEEIGYYFIDENGVNKIVVRTSEDIDRNIKFCYRGFKRARIRLKGVPKFRCGIDLKMIEK